MCGRFAFYSLKEKLDTLVGADFSLELSANYNVGPGQSMTVLCAEKENLLTAKSVEWGVRPQWSDGNSKLLINARAETVHEKSTFRDSFKQHRCVIVADGWFEWKRDSESKQPYYFTHRDNKLLTFAGLLFGNDQAQGLVLTRPAPKQLSNIHHRTPFILTHEQIKPWASNTRFSHVSDSAINAFDPELIEYVPVSAQVNNVRNNSADLLNPI